MNQEEIHKAAARCATFNEYSDLNRAIMEAFKSGVKWSEEQGDAMKLIQLYVDLENTHDFIYTENCEAEQRIQWDFYERAVKLIKNHQAQNTNP